MAFTQQNLDDIEAALASGEMTVVSNGSTVTYRSISELLRARDLIHADLHGRRECCTGGPRHLLADFSDPQ